MKVLEHILGLADLLNDFDYDLIFLHQTLFYVTLESKMFWPQLDQKLVASLGF